MKLRIAARLARASTVSTALALAGCSGATPFTNAASSSSAALQHFAHDASSDEVLSATQVTVKKAPGFHPPGTCEKKFKAGGTATGPFPGSFTANGTWSLDGDFFPPTWGFQETFAIMSGTNLISGTIGAHGAGFSPPVSCGSVGPAQFTYVAGSKTGYATVTKIRKGKLSETLQGL